ncbi:MAG: MazG nucleotide pyrophosphohydrolase domain-containing protein, partial [Gammaproteobacteria bacterium]|nr:MazG nucleotide pyrophosphohydrolase domain-containing protein [Gammaproteobacteria bacterium]
AAERGASSSARESLMDHVPRGLAALKRAQKLQKRAARAGFDWEGAGDVVPKIREELDELTEAMDAGAPGSRLEEELGDLLFSCVNLARHLRVDADMALRGATTKFEARFRAMESALIADGTSVGEADIEVMEAAWSKAKSGAG